MNRGCRGKLAEDCSDRPQNRTEPRHLGSVLLGCLGHGIRCRSLCPRPCCLPRPFCRPCRRRNPLVQEAYSRNGLAEPMYAARLPAPRHGSIESPFSVRCPRQHPAKPPHGARRLRLLQLPVPSLYGARSPRSARRPKLLQLLAPKHHPERPLGVQFPGKPRLLVVRYRHVPPPGSTGRRSPGVALSLPAKPT